MSTKMPNEELWKKLEQLNKQLEKYRALYKSDGTITQKEQDHLDTIQKKYDEASKALQARIKADADAEAKSKKEKIPAMEKQVLIELVLRAADTLAIKAEVNALSFAADVAEACDQFREHSKSRLKALEGEISAADFLGPLISIVTGGIGGALAKGANEVAAKIEGKILSFAKDTMNSKAKSIDKNDLEAAVGALVKGAKGMADGMKQVVEQEIVKRCTQVNVEVNAGRTLSPQLTAFIEPFIRASPDKISQLLEQHLGLPSPATAKKTRVEIYKNLVTKFEEKHIIATTSNQEKMKWNITGIPPQIRRNAEERGKAAAKTFESELKNPAPVGASR